MRGKLNFLQKLGTLLVFLSFSLLISLEIFEIWNTSAVEALTGQMISRLPPASEGDPQQYSDSEMPVMILDGKDFCALLRVPAFGVSLPVGNTWEEGSLSRYPHRFWGSAYDNSLVIGGSSQQFDFCGKLDIGDKILVKDMTGAEFSYETTGIERHPHADVETLLERQEDLTLFVRDDVSQGYIMIQCVFSP